MKLELKRQMDRWLGMIICLILSLHHRLCKNKIIKKRPQNILIILLSEMGSLVLAHPLFLFLKKKYPDAVIYVLLGKKNKEVMALMNVIPNEQIYSVELDSFHHLFSQSIKTMRMMRQKKIDTVIDCELFARISSIFSYLCGATIRVGFYPYHQEGLYRGDFINRRVLYNPYLHISKQFITLAKAIDSNTLPLVKDDIDISGYESLEVKMDRDEVALKKEVLYADFPSLTDKKLVLLYPGGGILPVRAWPIENYYSVAKALVKRDFGVLILGLKRDSVLANRIQRNCQNALCIDLTGYTQNINELMMMFSMASLLITNDGGPGHFASMISLPTISLYGPETPVLYGPLNQNRHAINLYSAISCSPCLSAYNHRKSPCDGDNVCLKKISPQLVLEKAFEALGPRKKSFIPN